jgi:hypothetical protein
LFGGVLSTSISPRATQDVQRPRVADRFRGLSAALAAARSQAPVPSATGAFRFAWHPELDNYVRIEQSLGPTLAERAQTLGPDGKTISFSYTRLAFDTLGGDSLDRIRSVQPALTDAFLSQLPASDRLRAADNRLETRLDLDFAFDLFFLTAAYGLTDSIDVSLALSLNRASMKARAQAIILDPNGDGGAFFTIDQQGAVVGGSGPVCGIDFRCAVDSFDDSAFGTGDVFLRSKWHFSSTRVADLAVAGVLTIPTGNAEDFLGFHDPTFTPWLIGSKDLGWFSPHVNVGYAFRSGEDVSQAEWVAGQERFSSPSTATASERTSFTPAKSSTRSEPTRHREDRTSRITHPLPAIGVVVEGKSGVEGTKRIAVGGSFRRLFLGRS